MKKYGTAMFNISGGVEGYDDEDHVCVCVWRSSGLYILSEALKN